MIDRYAELWREPNSGRYALSELEPGIYTIIDAEFEATIDIEDDETFELVINEMLKVGVPIIHGFAEFQSVIDQWKAKKL